MMGCYRKSANSGYMLQSQPFGRHTSRAFLFSFLTPNKVPYQAKYSLGSNAVHAPERAFSRGVTFLYQCLLSFYDSLVCALLAGVHAITIVSRTLMFFLHSCSGAALYLHGNFLTDIWSLLSLSHYRDLRILRLRRWPALKHCLGIVSFYWRSIA